MSPKSKVKTDTGWVYVIKANSLYKFGTTKRQPITRLKQEVYKTGYYIELVILIQTPMAGYAKKRLIKRFHNRSIDNKWFDLSSDDLDYIRSLPGYDQAKTLSEAALLCDFDNRTQRPGAWKTFITEREATGEERAEIRAEAAHTARIEQEQLNELEHGEALKIAEAEQIERMARVEARRTAIYGPPKELLNQQTPTVPLFAGTPNADEVKIIQRMYATDNFTIEQISIDRHIVLSTIREICNAG